MCISTFTVLRCKTYITFIFRKFIQPSVGMPNSPSPPPLPSTSPPPPLPQLDWELSVMYNNPFYHLIRAAIDNDKPILVEFDLTHFIQLMPEEFKLTFVKKNLEEMVFSFLLNLDLLQKHMFSSRPSPESMRNNLYSKQISSGPKQLPPWCQVILTFPVTL